jgi:ATP-dependent Lhr-like helicase
MRGASGRVQNLHIHHSSLAPATRKAAEEAFLSGDGACIICTSTLELGIDIGNLDVVVQVGPPTTVSSFLQRMGRSGRRGKAASVIWIVKSPCELLCSIAIIECAMERAVEDLRPPQKPYNVFLQQLFLSLHSHAVVSRRQVVRELLSYPAFGPIGQKDAEKILHHLLAAGFLASDGEMLMPGVEAERVFGRSNWKDLYSVITGGGEYRAVTPEGDIVGMLDARFVNSRENGDVSLGGRSWSMVKCDDDHDIVVVVPGGSAPFRTFWTGGNEEGYSPLVCQKVGSICARGRSRLPLAEPEQELIAGLISRLPPQPCGAGILVSEHRGTRGPEVMVCTFQGRRFNRVLAHLLTKKLMKGVQVRYDDFVLRVPLGKKTGALVRAGAALESIRSMERSRMVSALPRQPADGWKFARVLPTDLFTSFVASEYYHLDEFVATFEGMEIVVNPEPSRPADPAAER